MGVHENDEIPVNGKLSLGFVSISNLFFSNRVHGLQQATIAIFPFLAAG